MPSCCRGVLTYTSHSTDLRKHCLVQITKKNKKTNNHNNYLYVSLNENDINGKTIIPLISQILLRLQYQKWTDSKLIATAELRGLQTTLPPVLVWNINAMASQVIAKLIILSVSYFEKHTAVQSTLQCDCYSKEKSNWPGTQYHTKMAWRHLTTANK